MSLNGGEREGGRDRRRGGDGGREGGREEGGVMQKSRKDR